VSESTVRVVFVGDSSSAVRATSQVEGGFAGLSKTAKALGGLLAAAFAGEKIGEFVGEAVRGAAKLQKSTEGIKVGFGKASKAVLDFAEGAAARLGLSAQDAEAAAAQFALLFKNLRIDPKTAADMTVNLEKLGASLANIKGTDPAATLDKLRLAMAGNTRGLKELGIVVDAHSIKQEAMKQGLIATEKDALTPGQKALAIYGLATKDLGTIQTQAAAHSDDLLNKQRVLSAEWSNAKDRIGKELLPVMASLAAFLADNLPAAFKVVGDAVTGLKTAISDVAHSEAFQQLKDTFTTVIDVISKAWGIFGGTIKTILGGALKTLLDDVKNSLKLIGDVFKIFGDLLSGNWSKLWSDVKQLASDAVNAVKTTLQNIAQPLLTLATAAGTAIYNGVKAGLTGLGGAVAAAFSSAVTAVSGAVTQITGALARIPGAVKAAFVTGPIDVIKGALDAVWGVIQRILDVAGKVVNFTVDVAVNIPGLDLLKKIHVPGFQHGGIVPGPQGRPMLAVVHGGERVLGRDELAAIFGTGATPDTAPLAPAASSGQIPQPPPQKLAQALTQSGRLKLALGVEAVQERVLASFQKGTLHVPQTGVYQLHAGEQVTPAGRAGGGGSADSRPIVIEIHETADLQALGAIIDRRVVANTDAISVTIGRQADRRGREGRF